MDEERQVVIQRLIQAVKDWDEAEEKLGSCYSEEGKRVPGRGEGWFLLVTREEAEEAEQRVSRAVDRFQDARDACEGVLSEDEIIATLNQASWNW